MSFDRDCLSRAKPHDVLQTSRLIRHNLSTAIDAFDNPEVNEMDMDGVTPAARAILQFPNLDGSALGLGEHPVLDVRKRHSVDAPVTSLPVEEEVVINAVLVCRVRHIPEGRGYVGRIGDRVTTDNEAHDLICVQVVFIGGERPRVAEVTFSPLKAEKSTTTS
jgi:hypothetical protein